MTHPVDPKQFWEAKALDWERGRYGTPKGPVSLLEWIADRSSTSLRFRLAVAPKLLKPFLLGRRVVELGCGSGFLAGSLVEDGAATYLGIDIAESAIRRARERYGPRHPRITFEVGTVADMPPLAADVVISLGLFDWLTDAELSHVFRKSGSADFLHAIAERQSGLQQWLHRAYVQLAYGHRTGSYRPRYLTCGHVEALANASVGRPLYVYRDRRMSFGALVSSLPIGPEV